MKSRHFSLIIIVTSLFLMFSCSSDNKDSDQKPDGAKTTTTQSNPTFSVKDLDGNVHTLEEYKGRPLLLNFWGTWCPPCRRELPDLKRIYAEYKSQGLEIIGLAVNDSPVKVKEFIEKMGIGWVMLIADREAMISFKLGSGIPVSIFIDRDGNEVSRVIGARDYEFFKAGIEKIL